MVKRPAKARAAGSAARVRCAIYTRKSTEDGLEQEYNSLEAQRDACTAYILSQRHEGWTLLPDRYDDGGYSGGTLGRPGLSRLLAEVAAGRVDTIVIYKVDRLTRSLADFAKIVEVLDQAEASFVSVTQAFNTTTSMGRLTLNMLLSFAQFEREVTGERIRDKIAASKKKGLWMGGPVPLGYSVCERKLVVDEGEADLVRHIFQRYLALNSVAELVDELGRDGLRTKLQSRASGPHKGGCAFRRGTLFHLLSNRIYLGDIVHKGVAHRGEHPAIVPQALWDAVQTKRAACGQGKTGRRPPHCSALAGLLDDGAGRAMTASHAVKGQRRYRYYITRAASPDQPAWRCRAHDIEQVVAAGLKALLLDRNRISRMVLAVEPTHVEPATGNAAELASTALLADLPALGVERVRLGATTLEVEVRERSLLQALGVTPPEHHTATILLAADIRRVRQGHELRLVVAGDMADAPAASPDTKLVGLLADSIAAQSLVLGSPARSLADIAAGAGRCRKRLAKLIGLSFLAPDIVQLILSGAQPATLTPAALLAAELPGDWAGQRRVLGLA